MMGQGEENPSTSLGLIRLETKQNHKGKENVKNLLDLSRIQTERGSWTR